MSGLDTPLTHLLPAKAATVLRTGAGMSTSGDLFYYLPSTWRSLDVHATLDDSLLDTTIGVIGTVTASQLVTMRKTRRLKNGRTVPQKMLKLTVRVGSQPVEVAFFNVFDYFQSTFPVGQRVFLDGKLTRFGSKYQLQHPYFITLNADNTAGVAGGALKGLMKAVAVNQTYLDSESGDPASVPPGKATGLVSLDEVMALIASPNMPVYRAIKKVSTWDFLIAHASVSESLRQIVDPLPTEYASELSLLSLGSALHRIHHPGEAGPQAGLERLTFDEALSIALVQGMRRAELATHAAPQLPAVTDGLRSAWLPTLPFALTDGQQQVLEEIAADLTAGTPMNRLLQGDVGSGKTVVALAAMLYAVDQGMQAVLIAPTEVLARQHAATLTTLLGEFAGAGQLGADPRATSITLLTGALSASAREAALLDMMTGQAGIIVGTHALLTEGLHYDNLALVVVDEQHRFGVKQRDALLSARRDGLVPHVLAMTATPIPRTLALTNYGDIDISSLTTVPAGRTPIKSFAFSTAKTRWVNRMWDVINEQIDDGGQVYIVCPRIDSDDQATAQDLAVAEALITGAPTPPVAADPDTRILTSATWLYEVLGQTRLQGRRIGLVHGGLPSEEIATTMSAFADRQLDVLVSTTVIEVGVDNPNAAIMVICDADRFGVAQLHQLRGRVGRGERASTCFFLTSPASSAVAEEKLATIAATDSGFTLAELDLSWRREGDILGVAQSGPLKAVELFDITTHGDLITTTRRIAAELIASLGTDGVRRHPLWAHARRLLLRGGYDIDRPEG